MRQSPSDNDSATDPAPVEPRWTERKPLRLVRNSVHHHPDTPLKWGVNKTYVPASLTHSYHTVRRELFVSQSDHRIDLSCPASRHETRNQSHPCQNCRDGNECKSVGGGYAKQ